VKFSAGTARNFHVQAAAADIMRIAAILAIEAGIIICGPVHDAFLIEASIDQIEAAVKAMKACMARAVELVLGPGCTIPVDHIVARYPNSCSSWQRSEIFDIIIAEIAKAEGWDEARRPIRAPVGNI
jgi:hypothetical protein